MKRFALIFLVLVGSMGWGFVEVGYAGCTGKFDSKWNCVIDGIWWEGDDYDKGKTVNDFQNKSWMYNLSNPQNWWQWLKPNSNQGVTPDATGIWLQQWNNTNNPSGAANNNGTPTPAAGGSKNVTVIVTENIPGAGCDEISSGWPGGKKYKCTIKSGFETIQAMMGGLIKYATFLTALIGMLMVVFSGFQYATSAGDGDSQKKAVIRIQKLIGGLILLFLTGFILNTIAPWIYQ